jgi:hypothetical protein
LIKEYLEVVGRCYRLPHYLGLGWTTLDELHPLQWMNPYFLHIALTTLLENLLALPNATGLAASLREGLAHLNPTQLQALLECLEDWINDTVAENIWLHGGVSRADRSDLEWLLAASDYWHEEGGDVPPIAFSFAVVALLLEAQEANMLAALLPEPTSLEREIEAAWCAGLRPDALPQASVSTFSIEAAIAAAKQQAGRKAADVRHQHNRQIKQAGLYLYFNGHFRTDDEAFQIIGAKLHRALIFFTLSLVYQKARCSTGIERYYLPALPTPSALLNSAGKRCSIGYPDQNDRGLSAS